MHLHGLFLSEPLAAVGTLPRPVVRVCPHVTLQVGLHGEGLATHRAGVGLGARVGQLVICGHTVYMLMNLKHTDIL